jgi:hypothetical protein
MKLFDSLIRACISLKQPSHQFRLQEIEKDATKIERHLEKDRDFKYIICNGKPQQIKWDKVITYEDPSGLKLPSDCYKKVKNERTSTMFVAHWDVCLSSESCFKVLTKRKLSVHFLIDNDGTIYQIMDTNHIGYHAGNRKVNNTSIGVEISNAYYPRYQKIYVQKQFGKRPVLSDSEVHGRTLEPHLGFYPVQHQAFAALAKALNKTYDIPLEVPNENGQLIKTIYKGAYSGTFKGVVNHYHITKRKIDCAGFKIDEVIK